MPPRSPLHYAAPSRVLQERAPYFTRRRRRCKRNAAHFSCGSGAAWSRQPGRRAGLPRRSAAAAGNEFIHLKLPEGVSLDAAVFITGNTAWIIEEVGRPGDVISGVDSGGVGGMSLTLIFPDFHARTPRFYMTSSSPSRKPREERTFCACSWTGARMPARRKWRRRAKGRPVDTQPGTTGDQRGRVASLHPVRKGPRLPWLRLRSRSVHVGGVPERAEPSSVWIYTP